MRECERTGRKFLYWKQAAPSESIRLNPLENWSQPSEIPSRIAQLMEEGPFRDFAYLNNARQVPMLPDWAIVDLREKPGAVRPGKIAEAGFFDEQWGVKPPQK